MTERSSAVNADIRLELGECPNPAAPPNPAPDAMRDQVERIAQWLHDETGHPEAYPSHTWPETERDDGRREGGFVKIVPLHGQEYFRDIARRLHAQFLSAPVPPADGAIPLLEAFTRLERRLMSYCNHANAGHMPSDGREFARRILLGFKSAYEEAGIAPPKIDAETNDEYLAALSPSGTGAAEPDLNDPPTKWLVDSLRQLARDLLADPKTPWIGERDPRQHICWTAADRLAVPPVRRDREILRDVIMGAAKLHTHDHATALKIANDAILSLPVQPGAGERLTKVIKRLRLFIEALVKDAEHRTGQPALGGRQELEIIDAALAGLETKPRTCLDATGLKITGELYKAVSSHTGDACLLAMIGSWGDTLDDPDILAGLQRYNEMGECFIPDVATRQPPHSGDGEGR
jgi:hypothetical protein